MLTPSQLDDFARLAFEAPDMPFEFKEQHDFDLHIALEVTPDALDKMFAKGKAEGREVRGVPITASSARSISAIPTAMIEPAAKVPATKARWIRRRAMRVTS